MLKEILKLISEGYDAVRKIAILAAPLAKGKTVNFEEIYTEEFQKIVEDFKYAKAVGRSIKLLGRIKERG